MAILTGLWTPEIKNSVSGNAFQFLYHVILNESSYIGLFGDYNCNLLKENSLSHTCDTYDLHNLMTSATCFECVKGILIDPCLVSKPLRFKATLNLDCWLSDFHNFICITTKLNILRRTPNVIRYQSYKSFDRSKAFDSLPHGLLIAKLSTYRINFKSCNLLASYWHNRHQRVKLGDVGSESSTASKGYHKVPF